MTIFQKMDENDPLRKRTPPGQRLTTGFPVLTYGQTPKISTDKWKFRIFGLVEQPVEIDWNQFTALPQVKIKADFHCVTTWSRLDNLWEGVTTKELIKLVKIKPHAKFVMAYCYGGYTTNMALDVFLDEDCLLAHHWEGMPLNAEHGGPCRLIIPKKYAWKSAKWINGIEFLAEDSRGFWEANGYHNYADPWKEERYSSQE